MSSSRPIEEQLDADVVVVGAGMGGILLTHKLVDLGFSVIGIESGSDVGGVWFHNRYPGARVDLESMYYCYFDAELYEKWTWTERYASQPELLDYLNFAADLWSVRPHYRFDTTLVSGEWDERAHAWVSTTNRGERFRSRFLVMATGPLSAARNIDMPGMADFEGELIVSAHWPDRDADFTGERVGIIGTSASGVQMIPVIAQTARSVTVFQRTANYIVPAQNRPLAAEEISNLRTRRDDVRASMLRHPGATAIRRPDLATTELDAHERLARLEQSYAYGGHQITSTFTDQAVDAEANRIVADFVRDKVRALVRDPDVAELLMPYDYPIGTRRIGVDADNYYQSFNRDNVRLVDIKAAPIERLTPHAIVVGDESIELDVLILATGFDAMTGAVFRANLSGSDGVRLQDAWAHGPSTLFGLVTRGFPNLLIMVGPGSPSVLANMFTGNELHAEWIADLLVDMRSRGRTRVEPDLAAQKAWDAEVDDMASRMLRYRTKNYMVRENADGSRVFLPYPGGFDRYRAFTVESVENGYPELEFD